MVTIFILEWCRVILCRQLHLAESIVPTGLLRILLWILFSGLPVRFLYLMMWDVCLMALLVKRSSKHMLTTVASKPSAPPLPASRSEEHTSELQSQFHLVFPLFL